MPDEKKKPNILIIWGDDIGWFNISANNQGIMGYRTPNIDRVAKEGCNFTDWYGLAGRRRAEHASRGRDRSGAGAVHPRVARGRCAPQCDARADRRQQRY